MQILTFSDEYGLKQYGQLINNKVRTIKGNIFENWEVTEQEWELQDIKILPPVNPQKVICVGLNYKDHAEELAMQIPEEPVIFLKPPTTIIPHQAPIIFPAMSKRVDFEAELAVIIKEEAKAILEKDVDKYILGYTCANDVTARDLQKKDGQWTRAKSFDTFLPLGPVINTNYNPEGIDIKLFLNDQLKQSSNTSQMIFKIPTLISYISHIMTILPGDVILTGTPSGIGPMQRGDKVEVRIEGLDSLVNPIQ